MRELQLNETVSISAAQGFGDTALMLNSMAMSLCGGLLMLFFPFKIDLSFSGGILKNTIFFPIGAIASGILGPWLISPADGSLTRSADGYSAKND